MLPLVFDGFERQQARIRGLGGAQAPHSKERGRVDMDLRDTFGGRTRMQEQRLALPGRSWLPHLKLVGSCVCLALAWPSDRQTVREQESLTSELLSVQQATLKIPSDTVAICRGLPDNDVEL